MRIGNSSASGFESDLSSSISEIQKAYHIQMSDITKPASTKVMLGDTTVTDQTTFDVDSVRRYLASVTGNLDEDWSIQDVSETNDADLRRIFVKFESTVADYVLLGHIAIQFHALLYYKPDNSVARIQCELSEIAESLKGGREVIAEHGDRIISTRLRNIGYMDPGHEKLFELLYNDESLVKSMMQEVEEVTDDKTMDLAKRQDCLLQELDSLLVETYSTSPVLIDDMRLVTGEEGYLCTVDLEKTLIDAGGTKTRDGVFDLQEIPDAVKEDILGRMEQIRNAIVNKEIKEPE